MLGVVSESRELRPVIEARGYELQRNVNPFLGGLLAGRPNEGKTGGGNAVPLWVLYESGQVVLCRSRHEADLARAAAYHVTALQAALDSKLLVLRLRPILTPEGGVVLLDPDSIFDIAGHDRRLASKGFLVLPTTVVAMDAERFEVEFVEQTIDATIPGGTHPVRSIWMRHLGDSVVRQASAALALTRCVLRYPGLNLEEVIGRIIEVSARPEVTALPREQIVDRVNELGQNQGL